MVLIGDTTGIYDSVTDMIMISNEIKLFINLSLKKTRDNVAWIGV